MASWPTAYGVHEATRILLLPHEAASLPQPSTAISVGLQGKLFVHMQVSTVPSGRTGAQQNL